MVVLVMGGGAESCTVRPLFHILLERDTWYTIVTCHVQLVLYSFSISVTLYDNLKVTVGK